MAVSLQRSDDKSVSTNYTVQVLEKLAETGDRDAIVQGQRRISGREARSLILRVAQALANHGVGEGDRVALFIVNSAEALLLKLAVHFFGGRLVFVPPEPGNPELGAFIPLVTEKSFLLHRPEISAESSDRVDAEQQPLRQRGARDGRSRRRRVRYVTGIHFINCPEILCVNVVDRRLYQLPHRGTRLRQNVSQINERLFGLSRDRFGGFAGRGINAQRP